MQALITARVPVFLELFVYQASSPSLVGCALERTVLHMWCIDERTLQHFQFLNLSHDQSLGLLSTLEPTHDFRCSLKP
jgi:hypothetical protein